MDCELPGGAATGRRAGAEAARGGERALLLRRLPGAGALALPRADHRPLLPPGPHLPRQGLHRLRLPPRVRPREVLELHWNLASFRRWLNHNLRLLVLQVRLSLLAAFPNLWPYPYLPGFFSPFPHS